MCVPYVAFVEYESVSVFFQNLFLSVCTINLCALLWENVGKKNKIKPLITLCHALDSVSAKRVHQVEIIAAV